VAHFALLLPNTHYKCARLRADAATKGSFADTLQHAATHAAIHFPVLPPNTLYKCAKLRADADMKCSFADMSGSSADMQVFFVDVD